MSLARNTLVQSGFTMLSRLLGYFRDRAISNTMGAGWIGDAFATAQMFPNLFRRILAEGAFSQAFVPVYAHTQASRGDDVAAGVASQSLSVLGLASAIITVVAQIFMPWIMLIIHGGYKNQPEAFNLAILLTQITMPYLFGMALSSLFAGVLNTAGRFALTAAAPTLLNLSILAAVLLAHDPETSALYASIAICLAGVFQAIALFWGCRHLGVKIGWRKPEMNDDVKMILKLMGPAVIAGSATQINVFVSQALASFETGAKSWLYAADRLYQLPLGLIGVAIGVALLPRLSTAASSGDQADTTRALDEATILALAFTLPAAAVLMVAPYFLMNGFWTGGEFTSLDARATANALAQYGWGVPAFVLIRILAPPFFAKKDTKSPMRFALYGVVANVIIGTALFFALRHFGQKGYVGLAIGTSAAAWINCLCLGAALLKEKIWEPAKALYDRLARISVATMVMAVVVGLLATQEAPIEHWFSSFLPFGKEVAVLIVCLFGFGVYAVSALLTGALTRADIAGLLRRS